MQVIVHGGAGNKPEEPQARQAILDEAATAGVAESTVLDAVEAAVHVLESSPRFNAGVGGAVQSDGVIRTDAGIMTDERKVGAACSMPGVEHAVSVARAVLEETPHVLISADNAVTFADAFGVETGVDLWTERTREKWDDLEDLPEINDPRAHLDWLAEKFGGTDTVGAVARAGDRFAAATSTGGRWLALAGRVGDVPQIGSGFFAAPAGAASATGAGEDIAKATLCRRTVRHLESGLDAQQAADRAMEEFAELTGSFAGVIVLDRNGTAGSAFNSEEMQTAGRVG